MDIRNDDDACRPAPAPAGEEARGQRWGEDAFRSMVESAPTAMILVSIDGAIALVNAQAERLFGCPRAALIGQPVESLLPERFAALHPDHRRAFLADARPRPMGANRDLFARRRDGSEFPVEIGLTPLDVAGGRMVMAAIVDISERHRMEERFRRVVEYAPSAMVMIDREGRVVLVNAQTEAMFGYQRGELVGQPVELLVPERAREAHRGVRAGFVASPYPRLMGAGRELFGRRRDGSEFPVEIGLNPIETEDGAMVLASILDITERQRSRRVLEDALREKTALLNEVHHRVKNNLQVISSLLNLQASHTQDERLQAILQESRGRVNAMALTHQLLYEGKDFDRLDLRGFIHRLVQLLRSTYCTSASRVALRVELPEDRLMLELERAVPCGLLINELVTNAFRHAFPSGREGAILVRLEQCDEEHARLTVSDDGVGLPAGFELAEASSLGLQLVALFADQVQGRLDLESRDGTRFSLDFPVRSHTRADA